MTGFIDLEYQGHPSVIATAVLSAGEGVALVDPGPAVTLPTLRAKLARDGVSVRDVRTLLLTHIHLDHAGASGTLVRENPAIQVLVHERGAPHLIDPAKLLASAERLYGAAMGRLWGEVLPLPPANVRVLAGGETVAVGDHRLEVAYTPGHASHHVSYFDRSSGVAFVGDTSGIRMADIPYVFPPTPPPDIDLEAWEQSLKRIAAWRPQRLFLTHFGPAGGVEQHLDEIRRRLSQWSAWVRESLGTTEEDAARAARFAETVKQDLRRHVGEDVVAQFELGAAPQLCWYGLARYWRKRDAA